MDYDYLSNEENDVVEKIKMIENLVVSSKTKLNLEIDEWEKDCREQIKTLQITDITAKNKLKQGVEQLESEIAEVNLNTFNLKETEEFKRLKDLEKKESALITDISNLEEQIQHLRVINEKLPKHKKLTTHKDLVRVSKLLTGTSFDYQGPNISGFVKGRGFKTFNLDPTKLNEQELGACLWNVLAKESGEDWSDILNC